MLAVCKFHSIIYLDFCFKIFVWWKILLSVTWHSNKNSIIVEITKNPNEYKAFIICQEQTSFIPFDSFANISRFICYYRKLIHWFQIHSTGSLKDKITHTHSQMYHTYTNQSFRWHQKFSSNRNYIASHLKLIPKPIKHTIEPQYYTYK